MTGARPDEKKKRTAQQEVTTGFKEGSDHAREAMPRARPPDKQEGDNQGPKATGVVVFEGQSSSEKPKGKIPPLLGWEATNSVTNSSQRPTGRRPTRAVIRGQGGLNKRIGQPQRHQSVNKGAI